MVGDISLLLRSQISFSGRHKNVRTDCFLTAVTTFPNALEDSLTMQWADRSESTQLKHLLMISFSSRHWLELWNLHFVSIPNNLLLLQLHFLDICVSDLSSLCFVSLFSSVLFSWFFFFFYVSEVLPFSLFITVAVRNHPGMLHRMKCLGSVKGISLQRPPALQRASPGPGAGCLCTAMQGGFPFCFGTHGYCDVAESVHFWQ